MTYKTVSIWWNELQSCYMGQHGYNIVAKGKTLGGVKRSITAYLKREG